MSHKAHGNFKFLSTFNYYVPGWGGLVVLIAWFILGALLGNAVTLVVQLFAGAEFALEYGTMIAYPLMFIPAMIYASSKSRIASFNSEPRPVDAAGFNPLAAVLVVVATIALGLVTDALNTLMPAMPDWLKQALESMTTGKLWVNFICVSLFAPFFEEWLCRGMILRGMLGNGVKPVWAIVISAAFFALIHLNPWQAIPAFILGLLFGYVYWKTGSLKLTMLMHFTNNTIAIAVSRVDFGREVESWVDLLGAQLYWIVFAACVILIALCVRKIARISE